MPPGYISQNDAFEIAAADAGVIEKHIKAVECEVLIDVESPRNISAPITEKDGLFNALHHQKCTIAKCPDRDG